MALAKGTEKKRKKKDHSQSKSVVIKINSSRRVFMTTTVVASHCFSALACGAVGFVLWRHWNTLFCCFTADLAERRIFTMVGAAALACLVVAEVADRRRIAYYATRCILATTSSVALILPFASDTFEHGALHTYTLYVGLGFALALFSLKLAWYRGPSTTLLFLGSVASLAAYRLLFLSQYMSVDDKGTDRSCDPDTPFRWVENTLYATLVFLFAFVYGGALPNHHIHRGRDVVDDGVYRGGPDLCTARSFP